MEITTIILDTNNQHHSLFLIKPQTYMNTSGNIVPFLKKNSIKVDEILIVHDELEKKFGALSIKQGGSARGHNGLKSFIEKMGDSFWRLRFGIGRPEHKGDVPDYVLEPFSQKENEQLPALLEEAVQKIELSELLR